MYCKAFALFCITYWNKFQHLSSKSSVRYLSLRETFAWVSFNIHVLGFIRLFLFSHFTLNHSLFLSVIITFKWKDQHSSHGLLVCIYPVSHDSSSFSWQLFHPCKHLLLFFNFHPVWRGLHLCGFRWQRVVSDSLVTTASSNSNYNKTPNSPWKKW